MRGSAGSGSRPSTGIFSILNNNVTKPDGTKLVNLDSATVKADSSIGFDLPTCAMWETAMRAGVDTSWICGDTSEGLSEYAFYSTSTRWDNNGGQQRATYVGRKKPNNWGFYDPVGNSWNFTRDAYTSQNRANVETNGFKAISSGDRVEADYFTPKGGSGYDFPSEGFHRFSSCVKTSKSTIWSTSGCRVAYIPE